MKHRRLLTSKQPMAVINKSVDYTEAKRWEIKSGGRDLVNKSIDVCDNEGTFSPVSSKYNRHSMQHSPANNNRKAKNGFNTEGTNTPKRRPQTAYNSMRNSGVVSKRGICYGINNRFDNFKEAFQAEPRGYYFKSEVPNREKGPMMTGKNIKAVPIKSYDPGPGEYYVKIVDKKLMHSFGRGDRKNGTHSRSNSTTGEVSYLQPMDIGGVVHSFSQCPKGEINESYASNLPGPGHYPLGSKFLHDRSPSYSFSMGSSTSLPYRAEKQLLLEVKDLPARKSQKFAQADRWNLSHKEKVKLFQRMVKKGEKGTSLRHIFEEKNIHSIENYYPDQRTRTIENRMIIERVKQKCVRKARKKLNQNYITDLRDKLEKKQRKLQINTDKNETSKIEHSWMQMVVLGGWLQIIGEKFKTRKKVRERSNKLCTVLCYTSWAIGKFRRKLFKLRTKKVISTINFILAGHSLQRQVQKRIKNKNCIRNFIVKNAETPCFMHLLKYINSRVKYIQKWYRRLYVKKHLIKAIICMDWGHVEYEYLVSKAWVFKEENQEELLTKIEHNRKHNKSSNSVPLGIKLWYITKYIQFEEEIYLQNIKHYRLDCIQLKAEHEEKINSINAQRTLVGKSRIISKFVPPNAPYLHVFINKIKMLSLINHSLLHRYDWDDILNGTILQNKPNFLNRVKVDVLSAYNKRPKKRVLKKTVI